MADNLRPGDKIAFGKRRDGKGYDLLVIRDERITTFGPFRRLKDVKLAIATGDIGEPSPVFVGVAQ